MSHELHPCVGRTLLAGVVVLGIAHTTPDHVAVAQEQPAPVPTFELDSSWPKPLPNNWMFGQMWGVAVDSKDHVWVIHNPKGGWPFGDNTIAEIKMAGKVPAPAVVEFDAQGNVVQGWGGHDGRGYNWMQFSDAGYPYGTPAEHGIVADYKDNVLVVGNDHLALKFTPSGKFLLQIGELWKTNGSNDTRLLGNPTDLAVDPKTNEVYIADGYVNHRVVVFDADTGKYKRHWGAYGLKPFDGPVVKTDPNVDDNLVPDSSDRRVPGNWPLPQWLLPVHGVRIARDGLVYVCERQHSRVQVFQTSGRFVTEVLIPASGIGSASGVAFSPDPEQRYLYVADGKTWILRRTDLQILGSVDSRGNHYIAVDSKGNLYTSGSRSAEGIRTPLKYVLNGVPTTTSRGRSDRTPGILALVGLKYVDPETQTAKTKAASVTHSKIKLCVFDNLQARRAAIG